MINEQTPQRSPDVPINYLQAASSIIENSGEFFKHKKFLPLSLAALSYVSKSQNLEITSIGKRQAGYFIKLGILANDFYDLSLLNTREYKNLRRQIMEDTYVEDQFHIYFSSLRNLEKNRPKPGMETECIAYREKTNLISLASACSVAFRLPINLFANGTNPEIDPSAPRWFRCLFDLIMALQVVDDMVGYRGDSQNRRPSFFTALGYTTSEILSDKKFLADRFKKMGVFFSDYLNQAVSDDPGFSAPIARISKIIYKTLPGIAEFVRQPLVRRSGLNILTKRDTQQI